MITPDHLKHIAIWSRDLNERELERVRAGIIEKSYRADELVFMRGDQFDYWCGVVSGLLRMGTVSRGGKAMSFAGLTSGAWFGEGTMLKSEPRRYDMVALRDSRLALMDRATFFWLYENSVAFNRFLVAQLNERARRIWPHPGCDRAAGALDRLAVQPVAVSRSNASPGDYAGGNRSVVRHFAAERQSVPEAVGE
jgi:CRP-like cAMP-binding protein